MGKEKPKKEDLPKRAYPFSKPIPKRSSPLSEDETDPKNEKPIFSQALRYNVYKKSHK